MHVRVEPVGRQVEDLSRGKPGGAAELGLVVPVDVGFGRVKEKPQRHVGVDTRAARLGHSNEDRLLRPAVWCEAQLLAGFADDRLPRTFERLDVATGGQQKAGLAMVDQQESPGVRVYGQEIRDEMDGRRGGFSVRHSGAPDLIHDTAVSRCHDCDDLFAAESPLPGWGGGWVQIRGAVFGIGRMLERVEQHRTAVGRHRGAERRVAAGLRVSGGAG